MFERSQAAADEAIRKLTARLTSAATAAEDQRATLTSQFRQQARALEERCEEMERAAAASAALSAKTLADIKLEHKATIERMERDAADALSHARAELSAARSRHEDEMNQLRREAAERAATANEAFSRELELVKVNAAGELAAARDRHRRQIEELEAKLQGAATTAAEQAAAADAGHKAATMALMAQQDREVKALESRLAAARSDADTKLAELAASFRAQLEREVSYYQ
jgi:hypothetical protein